MVNYVRPLYTRSRIKSAGKRIVNGNNTEHDNEVIENFRASHAYLLNTFQSNLRNHSSGRRRSIGQRLKRRETIVDKLKREPNMPLYAMQEIAGCRLVFDDSYTLYSVRESMHSARFRHSLRHEKDKYDYIKRPKSTGYRGVHDVYEYNVSSVGGTPWNGLNIEIQYRTLPQHAWATAVEVADLVTSSRIKFNSAKKDYMRYFQLSSEIIARTSEKLKSCCSELSDKELAREFGNLDRKLGLLLTFRNLRSSESAVKFRKNMLLIFLFQPDEEEDRLKVKTFENVNDAIRAYDDLEKEWEGRADIVLVRGETEENIRDAFRNYFSDARAFIDLMTDGIEALT